MGKKYKIALSYSRKDSRIERLLEEELEKVFTGSVFKNFKVFFRMRNIPLSYILKIIMKEILRLQSWKQYWAA